MMENKNNSKITDEEINDYLSRQNEDLEKQVAGLKRENEIYKDCVNQVDGHAQQIITFIVDLEYSLKDVEDEDFGVPENYRNLD